jgi:RNA polymerase sigma-70 factor (ECF subfamily)
MEGKQAFFIAQFKQGNPDAYSTMYRLHYTGVFRYAHSIVNNRQDAEDIVSEVFLKLYKLREDFDSAENIKSFLFIAAKNGCLNYLKARERHAHHKKQLFEQMSADEYRFYANTTAEFKDIVQERISKLPAREQQIIKMIWFEGVSPEEIAERENLSLKTVRNIMYRAFALLRNKGAGGQLGTV